MTTMKKTIDITHPEYARQLVDKSLASKLTHGSRKKVEWECDRGHRWISDCNARFSGPYIKGCAICGNRKIIPGVNDILTTHSHKMDMWSPNNTIDPSTVSAGSAKKALFICKNGHEFSAIIHNVLKYGTGCTKCSLAGSANPKATSRSVSNPIVNQRHIDEWSDNNPPIEEFSAGSERKVWWKCLDCNYEWQTFPKNRTSGEGCPRCASGMTASKAEKEIAEFVRSLGFDVVRNERTLIAPREIDILVPDKLAIEYNGLYWHTEGRVGRKIHLEKFEACANKGIQLVTIWEDEWRDKKDIVKNMLSAKLGVSRGTLGARKTQLRNIDYKTATRFLERTHIQGAARGTYYLGLFTDKLIAVGVFKKSGEAMYLERYASDLTIHGGLDKMLTHLSPAKFVTFADNCVSSGGLYEKTGWIKDGALSPDYKYLHGKNRVHKFNFRLKRFRDDNSLIWRPGLSESGLAELNGIERIYDCGKTRYIKSMP